MYDPYKLHRSATTLKPLTGEVNSTDHLVTVAPGGQGGGTY